MQNSGPLSDLKTRQNKKPKSTKTLIFYDAGIIRTHHSCLLDSKTSRPEDQSKQFKVGQKTAPTKWLETNRVREEGAMTSHLGGNWIVSCGQVHGGLGQEEGAGTLTPLQAIYFLLTATPSSRTVTVTVVIMGIV